MRWLLGDDGREYVLADHWDTIDGYQPVNFETIESAATFLGRLLSDPHAAAGMRSVAHDVWHGAQAVGMDDARVLDHVAHGLVAGALRIVERPEAVRAAAPRSFPEAVHDDATWDAPPPETIKRPRPERPDAFGEQAATLVAAALDGMPFCEECAKGHEEQAAHA
jgi:hypothetical protein